MQLVLSNLSKTYGNGVHALNNVSLEMDPGMFGLLGPNGAGKSTLMRTLATLQEADSGSAKLGNIDMLKDKEEVRKVLGYLPQDFGFYPSTTAIDMLNHFAVLKGISNSRERKEVCENLLNQTNLWEARKRHLSSYSGGMRQRFGIAQALLGNPKLIIVDEPTAGLDPAERNRFHNILSEIGQNIVVILSTHIVEDVNNLCANMAIMNRGNVVVNGKTKDILTDIQGKIWSKRINKEELQAYKDQHKVISTRIVDGQILVYAYAEVQPEGGFEIAKADLEDVYFTNILTN